MPKGKSPNKSSAIRAELKKGVTTNKVVVAKLAKRGITVSGALVSQLKAREAKKAKSAATESAATGRSARDRPENGNLSREDIQAVLNLRRLVSSYGAAHVKKIVDEVATHA